jgi:nucleotide-binding universal stress UspA family protein
MFKQILVAIDGSPTGNRGLKAALELASSHAASLTIIHVVDDMQSVSYIGDMGYVPADYVDKLLDDLRANGRKILAKAEAAAHAAGVDAKALLVESRGGSIADAILAQTRKVRADTIVLGTHGRRGLRRALMGSDAEAVLRDSRVPVLLVRALAREPAVRTAAADKPRRATKPSA